MNLGIDVNEIIICKIAANNKTNMVDFISLFIDKIIVAIMIELGPVGPDTIGIFPPNMPVNKDSIIAPQSPAEAPSPEATPKASACGKAIIEAVIAPKKSPFRFVLNLSMVLI